MAQVELILQAVTDTTHAEAIRALFRRATPKSVLISVSFVREEGVTALEAALKPFAANSKLFIGIRNHITTVQAVKRLLGLKAKLYAVDTASRETIYHPKLYLVSENERASLIVGSANLTFSGLHNNIEASAVITLDLSDQRDRDFVEKTLALFDELVTNHPQHVFLIRDEKHAEALFAEGRLADEVVIPAPALSARVRKGARDTLPRMNLRRVGRPLITAAVRRRGSKGARKPAPGILAAAVRTTDYYLVWESKELTRRDLNVPTSARTHRTGSMTWKRGALEGIDQRHFFRDEIFKNLTWRRDPRRPHMERTEATFGLVVKNLNYGSFKLRLTHNTRTDIKTYRQRNAMTWLHWDGAAPIVMREELLGRTMRLFRKDTTPPQFLIEID